jgi:hypothetical protein
MTWDYEDMGCSSDEMKGTCLFLKKSGNNAHGHPFPLLQVSDYSYSDKAGLLLQEI